MNNRVIFHPGTGTVISVIEAVVLDLNDLAQKMGVDLDEADDALSSGDATAVAEAEALGKPIPTTTE